MGRKDEDPTSFVAQPERRPFPGGSNMTVALRPATFKMLLIAAGVLLGLLAIALLVAPEAHGSHGAFVDAAKVQFVGKLRPLGVLWH